MKKDKLLEVFNEATSQFPKEFIADLLRPTGRGGTFAKRDYDRVLRLIGAVKKYSNIVPSEYGSLRSEEDILPRIHPAILFRCLVDTPNLCYHYDELSSAEQEELFNSGKWVFSSKEDGLRCWLMAYNVPESGFSPGVFMVSRNYSEVDRCILEYWGQIYQSVSVPRGTFYVVDCECEFKGDVSVFSEYNIVAETKLAGATSLLQMEQEQALAIQAQYLERTGLFWYTFTLIHPLYINGKNFVKASLGEGIDEYDNALRMGQSMGFNMAPVKICKGSPEEKSAFLEALLGMGEEGVVCWNREGIYEASENRSKTSWVKIKRSVSGALSKQGLGDTIEAFVTGFKMSKEDTSRKGLIGALEFSIYIEEADGSKHPHVISYCPGIPLEMARKITILDHEGIPTLHSEVYNSVWELDGQDISSRSLRLSHPRMKERRKDKCPEDCVYTRVFLESQVL